MKVTTNISEKDYFKVEIYTFLKSPSNKLNLIVWGMLLIFSIVKLYLVSNNAGFSYTYLIYVAFFFVLIFAVIYDNYNVKRTEIKKIKLEKPDTFGEHTIEIAQDGVNNSTLANKEFYKWEMINSVKKNRQYILFFISAKIVIIIAKRDFESVDEEQEFYNKAVEYWNATRNVNA